MRQCAAGRPDIVVPPAETRECGYIQESHRLPPSCVVLSHVGPPDVSHLMGWDSNRAAQASPLARTSTEFMPWRAEQLLAHGHRPLTYHHFPLGALTGRGVVVLATRIDLTAPILPQRISEVHPLAVHHIAGG